MLIPPPLEKPLLLSQVLLRSLGTQISLYYGDRIPAGGPILFISNHRSFMDALLLMVVADRSIHFACHPYMTQVPILRDVIEQLGCLPLSSQPEQNFFQRASLLLQNRQAVGIFPEGAPSMITPLKPSQVGTFERGFAHLALRLPLPELQIVPVAIAALEETCYSVLPLKCFSWFDPSEPMFKQEGWHPLIVYQRVSLLVGSPWSISPSVRASYQGRTAIRIAAELSEQCQTQIQNLLQEGYY